MTKALVSITLALGALAPPALAGETTVTLAVRNWYCAACPHVVKQSLAAVPGDINVAVSDKAKTATVTFDDTKADVKTLAEVTTAA
ncbi:MAG: cation transporter, partial [Methylocella sp.]